MAPNPKIRSLVLILLTVASSSIAFHLGLSNAQPLTLHAPIFIASVGGVENFTSAGGVRSGTGDPLDPYVISDWQIVTDTSFGIHIKNTQKFFIIRDVVIQRTSFTGESEGIFLENVQNGIVVNVSITNFNNGVWVAGGTSNLIMNSRMWNNTYAINMGGTHTIASGNHLYNNARYGVLVTASFNTVTGNNASANGDLVDGAGIIVSTNNNVFENNTLGDNTWFGVKLLSASDNQILRNRVYRNGNATGGGGIVLSDASDRNLIMGNNVTKELNALGLEGGVNLPNTYNNITLNRVTENTYGIYLTTSDAYNTIYDNYLDNAINALDFTSLNYWNTTKTVRTNILGGPFTGGNFFADYEGLDADGDGIGDTPYFIQGGSQGQQAQDLLPLVQNQPAQLVNIIANPSFEQGVMACSRAPNQQCPVDWDFSTCEGVDNATVAVDPSESTNGSQSARVATGPLTPTGCFPGDFTNRAVGFSQLAGRVSNQGYNFTTLTDSSQGFSFWFKLQPYNASTGMAGFEVRIFGAESIAEMDYVINPDPSIGNFVNNTGIHSFTFRGYNYGQWYHFSRNLKADWINTGLPLNHNFTLVQFQGFATKSGTTIKSETFWLDDVQAYVGAGQIINAPDFTITANPDTLVIPPNGTLFHPPIVTVTSLNGFSGSVHLLAQVNPPGLIVELDSFNNNNASLTLTLSPNGQNATAVDPVPLSSTPPGTYLVTVTATSGAVTHSAVVTFILPAVGPNFSIAANPTLITLKSNGEASSNITLTSLNGFSGVVNLSTAATIGIVPIGSNLTTIRPFLSQFDVPTITVQPSTVFLSPNATAFATLTVTGNGAQQGLSFSVIVTGTNGSISHSTTVSVLVLRPPPDFDLFLSLPRPLVVIAGGSISIGVSLFSRGPSLFNGTVTLTGQISPSINNGPVVVIDPDQISLAPPGPSSATVLVSTSTSTPPGNYNLTITGTSGTLGHSVQVQFTVLPPPVITVNPSSGTIGSLVSVQGRDFPMFPSGPFSSPVEVELTFDNQLVGFIFLHNSSFTFAFDVPLSQPGAHQVHAVELFPTPVDAQANFTVLFEQRAPNVKLSVGVGSIYFPGETAVISVQTIINGQAASVANLRVVLIRPNGSNLTLTPTSVSTGLWKTSYLIPASGSIGTYSVVVSAHQPGSSDGSALVSFEVKPTWLQSHASTITGGGLAIIGVGLAVAVWRKGLLVRRKDELSTS